MKNVQVHKKPTLRVSATDVKRRVRHIQAYTERPIEVDRPCQKGDHVTLAYEMWTGGKLVKSVDPMGVVVGTQIREMERAVQGLRVGESAQFCVGPVEHRVRVTRIEARVKREGEDLAHHVGAGSPADLNQRVRGALKESATRDMAADVVAAARKRRAVT